MLVLRIIALIELETYRVFSKPYRFFMAKLEISKS